MCRLVQGNKGVFTAADLQKVLRPSDSHFPQTRLVCLENTHNRSGGRVFPLAEIEAIAQICQAHDLKLHLDGARLWNACIATGVSEADYAKPFDTVSVCFSKGLGAPVGSALVGSAAQMQRARRFRKMFGGGMRQAGIIAAGALYGVQHQRSRLQEDHDNAQFLAKSLQQIPGIQIKPEDVQTNIVVFHTPGVSAAAVAQELMERGVGVLAIGAEALRAVTNLMVTEAQVRAVPEQVESVLLSFKSDVNSEQNQRTHPARSSY
jgi:threonine aldolase